MAGGMVKVWNKVIAWESRYRRQSWTEARGRCGDKRV